MDFGLIGDIVGIVATFDIYTGHSKTPVKSGTTLVTAGAERPPVAVVHSGLVELLDASPESAGRFGLIKGNAVCLTPDRSTGTAPHTVRARTECVVSTVSVDPASPGKTLAGDPAKAAAVLRGLGQAIESTGYLFRNYKYLWHKVASIADTIALVYDFGPEILEPRPVARTDGLLAEYSSFLRAQLSERETPFPAEWDPSVFNGELQDQLDLYGSFDAISIEKLIDLDEFRFLRAVLGKPNQVVAALLQKDAKLCDFAYSRLERALSRLLARNAQTVTEISTLLEMLLGRAGWATTALRAAQDAGADRFTAGLAVYNWRYYKDVINLLGRDLKSEYPLYGELRRYASGSSSETPSVNRAPADTRSTDGLAKYKNLTAKLLDFAGWDGADREEFEELLSTFRSSQDKLGDERQLVHVRSRIAVHFWQLYEECFLKVLSTDLKSFIPGIFLHFGVFDEALLSEEDLEAIDQAYAGSLYVDEPIPTMTLPFFLEKIFQGEQSPSISEMGEEFKKVLKNQGMTRKDREGAYLYRDTPEDRVRYEIRTIAAHTAPLLFGSRKRYAAPLCGAAIIGKAERQILAPESLAERINEYRHRDFALFVRDVGLRHKFGTDIIQKEVVPNIVVYPTAGSRMMMWQEIDGTSRHTRGRLFVPFVFNEKRDEALATLLSQFKWELQKTVAGANWMDPVEGGLVGAYYDYINFYQKNHKLSSEAKERIKALVKKTRSDRDRFSSDYVDWVLHEFEGKIRLNPVAREIFYRYCPFPAQTRVELQKKPLYADLEHKYQNRQTKAITKIESRFKRFERESEPVPEDLQRHLEFLKS